MAVIGLVKAIFQLDVNQAVSASKQLNTALTTTGAGMQKLGAAGTVVGGALTAGLTVPILGAAAASIKFAADFNAAMTQSTAIMTEFSSASELTAGQQTELKTRMEETARAMSVEFNIASADVAEGFFFLASAGLTAEQQIAALPQVTAFAKAGMFDLATATDLATDAQSALGLTVPDAQQNLENLTRVTDVLVKANTLANASVEQFSVAMTTKAGAALKILGKDIEEGTAVLAAFADQGVKGQLAGTGLNIVLRDLSTKALKNASAFRENKVAVFDASGEMNNMGDIVGDLEKRLDGMSDAEAKATLLSLGFADKSIIFIQTLIGMSDKIKLYEEDLRKAGGTTQEVADKQMQAFTEQMGKVKMALIDVAVEIGAELLPKIQQFVNDAVLPAIEKLKEWADSFADMDTATQVVIIGLAGAAAAIGPVILVASQLLFQFSMIVTAIPTMITLLKGLQAAFVVVRIAAFATLGVLLQIAAAFGAGVAIGTAIRNYKGFGEALDKFTLKLLKVEEITSRGQLLMSEEDLALMTKVRELMKEGLIPEEALHSVEQAEGLMRAYTTSLRESSGAVQNLSKVEKDGLSTKEKLAKEGDALFESQAEKEAKLAAAVEAAAEAKAKAWDDFVKQVKIDGEILEIEMEKQAAREKEAAFFAQDFGAPSFNVLGIRDAPQPGAIGQIDPDATTESEILAKNMEAADAASKEFLESMEGISALANIIGGKAGSLVGSFSAIGGSLKGLMAAGGEGASGFGGIASGIGNTFSAGMEEAGGKGALGLLGGLSSVMPMIGPMIGPAIQAVTALFKIGARSWKTVAEEAGRDMGVSISQGLAEQIHQAGGNIQEFLPEIFAEGALSADALAREVGDIFSVFEQGDISQQAASESLRESIPLLIENYSQLGEAGESEIQRILEAADRLGFEMDELNDLVQAAFAPSTVEGLMEAFELTREQVLALEESTGVKIQTNLQRMAAEAGITAKEMRAVAAAAAEQGFEIDEIAPLAEALGITVAQLAESWGVDVASATEDAGDALAGNTQEIENAVDAAKRLEAALRDAASVNINIPTGDGGGSSPPPPGAYQGAIVHKMAFGGFRNDRGDDIGGFSGRTGMGIREARGGSLVTRPTVIAGENGAEVVAPVRAIFGSLASKVSGDVQRQVGRSIERASMVSASQANLIVSEVRRGRLESQKPKTDAVVAAQLGGLRSVMASQPAAQAETLAELRVMTDAIQQLDRKLARGVRDGIQQGRTNL